MSINLDDGCACSHHQLLNLIKEGANDEARLLLQKQEHTCDAIENSKAKLLHYAVLYNTIMIQPLIDHGCNVNTQDNSGDTPLILAIIKSNVTAVDVLLKNNADVYAINSSGENSLQMACLKCYDYVPCNSNQSVEFDILKKVFEKVNSDYLKDKNNTKTKLILKANDTVKLAVVANAHVELAKIVLENDYPLNFHEFRRGFTALHVAIMFRNIKNVLLLIEHGADVDAHDESHYSAIHSYLSDFQDIDENSIVLNRLLCRTKGLYSRDRARKTDFEHCLKFGNEKTVRVLLQNSVQKGIDVCAMKFHGGKSMFHVLIENENTDVYRILDEFDIPCVNARDGSENTALSTALRCIRVGVVEYLLKRGADVNLSTRDSPLLFDTTLLFNSIVPTMKKDMLKITALLLEYGADAQYVFGNGDSLIKRLSYKRGDKVLNSCDKLILAHLALLAKIENSLLTELTRNDVESAPLFKAYFVLCTEQLEEMKNLEVYGHVTLLKLLTEDEEKITAYARNLGFILAFSELMKKYPHLEQYYSIIMNKRVGKAIEASRFEMKLGRIIENLTGICSDVYRIIIHKIISYLGIQDKKNLCNIEDTHSIYK